MGCAPSPSAAAPPARSSCASWQPTRKSRTATTSSPPASMACTRPGSRSPPSCASSATRSAASRGSCASRPRGWTAAASSSSSATNRRRRRGPPRPSPPRSAAATSRAAAPRTRRAMGPDSPQHILMPVRLSTIALSFAVALLLNFLPWPDLKYTPDFVALVLCFWCVRQPRLVGLGVAWALGLLTDAGNGVLLGQHALAYSLLAFLAIWLSRRILWFGPLQQAFHVAPLLLASQA